jgi:hypothetical protein
MNRFVWNVVAVAAVVTLGVLVIPTLLSQFRILAGDEPPIRVRNGSLDILAGTSTEPNKRWQWEPKDGDNRDPAPSYSHEPAHIEIDTDEELWVKVVPAENVNPVCNDNQRVFSGERVAIDYQEQNAVFTARLRRGKRPVLGINYRTKVRPKDKFTLDGTTLRYAGTGFIKEVRAGYGKCLFTQASDLEEILICSSSTNARCQ